MNNTMLAERQPETTEWETQALREPVAPRLSSVSTKKYKAVRRHPFRGDWLTIAVMLACMATICVIGVVYVAAFARITWQGQQLTQADTALATASAEHEALQKQVAFLESDNRIAPRAVSIGMSQSENDAYIEELGNSSTGLRQVASAQQ